MSFAQKMKSSVIIALVMFSVVSTDFLLISTSAQEDSDQNHITEWLFALTVNQTEYRFRAEGAAHIIVDIAGTDYATFTLDNQSYVVSFGSNDFSMTFPDWSTVHVLSISRDQVSFFETLCVEPVILYDGVVDTSLDTVTNITFSASGPISILTRPEFLYNWLYLQLDDVVIKHIYETTSYPEVDSAFYAALVEGGTYIRDDISVAPGTHTLLVEGNGSLDIKMVVNLDYDNDTLTNPEEVMYEGLYDVDPLVPDTWGFFEQSSDLAVIPYDEAVPAQLSGRFSFYLPPSQVGCSFCGSGGSSPPNYLYIDAYAGEFYNFTIDDDATLLNGVTLVADYPNTPPASQFVSSVAPGWHTIQYNYLANPASISANITFRINVMPIQVINIPELQDTSGSGIKDAAKYASGLNPYTPDTDSDGLPDNLESSPTSSLVLDPTKITQVILPTSSQNNTLLSMQVRKPAVDYSTGGGSRIYCPYFYGDVIPNLKVVLALRLFGNSSITRSQLEGTWGKPVQTYSLVPGYNAEGAGDDMPVTGPDGEYAYIMPLAAKESFEYDFNFSKACEAKNDGNNVLDLRFDFVWLVINGSTNILHIYDPEEPIVVQSWAARDVGNITYILGSPTCMVENQALWALVQNPALGSLGDYGLGNCVVGSGSVDYFSLPAQILQDRDNHPRNATDTEVLYVATLESNLDILNKIRLQAIPNATFEDLHEGDYEALFSYYSVSDVYNGTYKAGDPALQGENKIVFQTCWVNITNETIQKTNLLGFPININIQDFNSSKILNLTRVIGNDVPTLAIPTALTSNMEEHVQIWYQTYIESKLIGYSGIPPLNYDDKHDLYKEEIHRQQQEADLNGNSPRPAVFGAFIGEPPTWPYDINKEMIKWFQKAASAADAVSHIKGTFLFDSPWYNRFQDAEDDLRLFCKFLENRGESVTWNNYRFSFEEQVWKVTHYVDYDAKDLDNLVGDLYNYESKLGFPYEDEPRFDELQKLNKFNDDIKKDGATFKARMEKEAVNEGVDSKICILCCDNGVEEGISAAERNARLTGAAIGAVSIAMGAFMLWAGIAEIMKLQAEADQGLYDNHTLEFGFRMAGAISLTACGVLLVTLGVVTFAGAVMRNVGTALTTATNFLGKALMVVGILITVFQIGTYIAQYLEGTISEAEFWDAIIVAAVMLIFLTIVPWLIGLAAGGPWGTIAAVIIAAAFGLMTLIQQYWANINQPNFTVTGTDLVLTDDTLLSMKRHGSLTVGDTITYRMNVQNTGKTVVWAQGGFLADTEYMSDYTVRDQIPLHGEWSPYIPPGVQYDVAEGGYAPDATDTWEFANQELESPTANLECTLLYEVDWNHAASGPFIMQYDRVPATREFQRFKTGWMVMPRTISEFYNYESFAMPGPAPPIPPQTMEELKSTFAQARAEYRYKDAYTAANGVIALAMIANNQTEVDTYTTLRDQLPLRTNVAVDLARTNIQVYPGEPTPQTLFLSLDGPDNPVVDFEVIPPSGFTAVPDIQSIPLAGPVTFTLSSDPDVVAGIFTLVVKSHLSGAVLFQGNVPFRLVAVSDVRLVPGATVIIPGETKVVVSLENHGDTPEFVDFNVDGIPASYIDNLTNPNGSLCTVQSVLLMPGECRNLTLRTTRAFWEAPHDFPYTAILRNTGTGQVLQVLTGLVSIVEFYDLEMSGTHLDLTGTDKDISPTPGLTAHVVVTNRGNVPQDCWVLVTGDSGWYHLDGLWISPNSFTLAPGASQAVEISLISRVPFSTTMHIEARTQYNSTMLAGSVSIEDDDIDPPVIEGIDLEGAIAPATITDAVPLVVKVKATDANGIWKVNAGLVDANGEVQAMYSSGTNPVPVDGWYQVTVPYQAYKHFPGTYTVRVSVTDADTDYPLWYYYDQLSISEDLSFIVMDDDTTPPNIAGVDFLSNNHDTDEYIWMRTYVSDQESGVGLVSVEFNGRTYYAYPSVNPSWYLALLPTPLTAGSYVATVTAWDADNDRPDDQLSNTTSVVVTVTNTAPVGRLYYSNAKLAGDFPGTYTFSDHDPVPFAKGWQAGFHSSSGQPTPGELEDYCCILPEYAGHAGVLQLYKNASVDQVLAVNFARRVIPAGTVEFWLAVEGDANFMAVLGSFSEAISGPYVIVVQGQLLYYSASGNFSILGPFDPGWHHLRIDFAGTGGIFPGLAENQVAVTLDGFSFDPFDAGAPMKVAGVLAGARDTGNATEPAIGSLYLDAIGFSWDPAYIIGSNKFPGIDLTPRDYTGEYRATYTFGPVDPLPATQGWFMAAGQAIPLLPWSIVPEYLDHQTVLTVPVGQGSELIGAFCPLVPAQVAGTIELWLAMEGDEGTLAIESAMTGGQWVIFAAINDGQLLVPNAAGTYTPIHSFPIGEWHHLRLDFAGPGQTYLGLGANQYRLFLDQKDLGNFSASVDLTLDLFLLAVQNVVGTGAGKIYADAVGFSWDPNYAIGQNLVVSGPPATPVLTIEEGEPGATMTWAPKDASFEATSYSLYVDGILSTSGAWTYGSRISLDLSTLAPGEHLLSTVFDDGIGGETTSSIIVRVIGQQENLLAEIDALIAAIQSSSDADWRCPATCHKHAILEKLEEVKDLVEAGRYAEAYDKLLHDVKPKLTGLKTDETEIPWGNGVFHKPWVTNPALQQSFRNQINSVLRGIKSLDDSTPAPPCHGHHGGHCHDPHPGEDHHCNSHHEHAHGPNHGQGNHCGSGGHPACHAY